MKVLVTGATGFVGRGLVSSLVTQHHQVLALVRKSSPELPNAVQQVECGDLIEIIHHGVQEGRHTKQPQSEDAVKEDTRFTTSLERTDIVVHLAARVHIMNDSAGDPLEKYRLANTEVTLNLAKHAAEAGVKRFIYLSSIKVNGESTNNRSPFTESDVCKPTDPYGISKYEAEQGLLKIAEATGMEVVIIRPPLVYGPEVKGNFARMIHWIEKGIPLPLGAIHNHRSLLALDNLIDFIRLCLDHPGAANEIFLISDSEDISTTELIRKIASTYELSAKLVPVPMTWMRAGARLLGKADVADRLFGSLRIDASKARKLLGWQPKVTLDKQLKNMVKKWSSHKP